MLVVFEGYNNVGKTTAINSLFGNKINIPVLNDRVNRQKLIDMDNSKTWHETAIQRCFDVAEFSTITDIVVDRWLITSVVEDIFRDVVWKNRLIDDLLGYSHIIFAFDMSYETYLERTPEQYRENEEIVKQKLVAYRDWYTKFFKRGANIRFINVDRLDIKQVVREIGKNWGKIWKI